MNYSLETHENYTFYYAKAVSSTENKYSLSPEQLSLNPILGVLFHFLVLNYKMWVFIENVTFWDQLWEDQGFYSLAEMQCLTSTGLTVFSPFLLLSLTVGSFPQTVPSIGWQNKHQYRHVTPQSGEGTEHLQDGLLHQVEVHYLHGIVPFLHFLFKKLYCECVCLFICLFILACHWYFRSVIDLLLYHTALITPSQAGQNNLWDCSCKLSFRVDPRQKNASGMMYVY